MLHAGDLKALSTQILLQQIAKGRIIVDDEYADGTIGHGFSLTRARNN
jgi:hypothetical protein